jgi:hypothetical protein
MHYNANPRRDQDIQMAVRCVHFAAWAHCAIATMFLHFLQPTPAFPSFFSAAGDREIITEFFSIFVSSAKAVRTVYALFESLMRDSAAQRQPRAALILGVIYFKWV